MNHSRDLSRTDRREGVRNTIFWVSKNPEHEERKRMGMDSDGVAKFKTASSYTGEWKADVRDGFGSQVYKNGDKYEGGWVNGRRHGRGTLWLKRGGTLVRGYTGGWADGTRHGVGTYWFKNGDRYEGEWHLGKRSGRGRQEYANGDVYEGGWLEGKCSGLGVLSHPNGNRFEGHWANGLKEGPGNYYYFNTRKVYVGEWLEGIAKCGEYSSVTDAEAAELGMPAASSLGHGGGSAGSKPLPTLGLAEPDAVLDAAVFKIQAVKADRDMDEGVALEELYSIDEIRQLEEAFVAAGAKSTGIEGRICARDIGRALQFLGVHASEDDLNRLLADLGLGSDMILDFDSFAREMYRLKDG